MAIIGQCKGPPSPGALPCYWGDCSWGAAPPRPAPPPPGLVSSSQINTSQIVKFLFWHYHAMPADRGRLCRATLHWLLLFKCDLRPARSPAPRPAVKQLSVVVFWPIFPVLLHSARLLFVVCLPIPSTTQFHSNTTTAVLFT